LFILSLLMRLSGIFHLPAKTHYAAALQTPRAGQLLRFL